MRTCQGDGECGGGRCVPVGDGIKACVRTKSCTGAPGADARCGGVLGDEAAEGADDCCETRAVPGGTYNQFNDRGFPATVSPFMLDRYEITTGRFRAWVEATDGNLHAAAPVEGAGAHPLVAKSGWRSEWNRFLPASRAEVDAMLGPEMCQMGSNLDDWGALTWWTESLDAKVKSAHGENPDAADVLAENSKEALDHKPLNCVPWEVMFAFCVWDGGRLPTNAEWGFAAAAGAEQRAFPWGSPAPSDLAPISGDPSMSKTPFFTSGRTFTTAALFDPTWGKNSYPETYALTWGRPYRLEVDNAAHIAPVGRKVPGNGKWGHADLAGGMHEWMLDEGPIRPGTCTDCANVDWPAPDAFDPRATEGLQFDKRWFAGGARAVRGGAWDNALLLAIGQSRAEIDVFTSYPIRRTYRALGGRCARDF